MAEKDAVALVAAEAPPRTKPTNYPEPFASRMKVGDRTPGDEGSYPDDDLKAVLMAGKWQFTHKDGTPY